MFALSNDGPSLGQMNGPITLCHTSPSQMYQHSTSPVSQRVRQSTFLIQYKIPFLLSNSKPIHLGLVKIYYYFFYGVPLGVSDSTKKLAIKIRLEWFGNFTKYASRIEMPELTCCGIPSGDTEPVLV